MNFYRHWTVGGLLYQYVTLRFFWFSLQKIKYVWTILKSAADKHLAKS